MIDSKTTMDTTHTEEELRHQVETYGEVATKRTKAVSAFFEYLNTTQLRGRISPELFEALWRTNIFFAEELGLKPEQTKRLQEAIEKDKANFKAQRIAERGVRKAQNGAPGRVWGALEAIEKEVDTDQALLTLDVAELWTTVQNDEDEHRCVMNLKALRNLARAAGVPDEHIAMVVQAGDLDIEEGVLEKFKAFKEQEAQQQVQ